MILTSKKDSCGSNKTYNLNMDEAEYKQALEGATIYRATACSDMAGEWQVKFKKFSKAKRKRMNLL